MPRNAEPGRSVTSRLSALLFAFRSGNSSLTLADLTRRTGMPHATVRRLVLELLSEGLLERTADGKYVIGIRVWELGTLAPRTLPLRTVALPFMEDLHAALQQHVQLAVLEGIEAVVVERMSTSKALGLVSQVGGRLPLHSSGVGKVLLAHGGESLLQQVTVEGLKAYTPTTITDPEQLRSDLGEYRRKGFALVNQETSRDAQSVATAIFGTSGECVAALSVVVAAGTLNLNSVVPAVVAAGRGISRGLGAAMPRRTL
ncbi:IclR family transcriptional regulator [Pseudarthrobacter sp. fls2-241-R2A-168]|uniref:IclR family transcriptional regulator n=1 Tax=Pseudarthrobacter sp. fls2-241-R2A-168 TaxID=3040304 RepID=UPI002552E9A1|nr:IclR family transcriptional regulator [Pseudarthrobacter sp. fls2-241-R2A-168]